MTPHSQGYDTAGRWLLLEGKLCESYHIFHFISWTYRSADS